MDVNSNKVKEKDARGGRELFYGVIAVASFIVMAVGATFAYFTATASSANSSIGTSSTTLELEYVSYNEAWMKDDLIPANTAVVEYSVEYQDDSTSSNDTGSNTLCVDDYGNSICSVYQFKVINNSNSPQTVSLDIVSETNTFSSLNAMAYELSVVDNSETAFNEVDYYNKSAIAKQIFGEDGQPALDEEGNNTYEEAAYTASDPVFMKNDGDTGVKITDGDGTAIYEADLDNSIYAPIYVNRKYVKKQLLTYNESEDSTVPAINRLVVPVDENNMAAAAEARTVRVADNITVYGVDDPDGNLNYKNFIIVLYIRNSNVDQTATDADKDFTGMVVVSNGAGGTGVSGTISAVGASEEEQLQSGTENTPGVSQ